MNILSKAESFMFQEVTQLNLPPSKSLLEVGKLSLHSVKRRLLTCELQMVFDNTLELENKF